VTTINEKKTSKGELANESIAGTFIKLYTYGTITGKSKGVLLFIKKSYYLGIFIE